MDTDRYDVIIIGGGHAGCEAAAAAARLGCQTLMVTMNLATIGQMSCNPAMGGVAKGQIVRELDALGGLSGLITDESAIQYRLLNRSKGPAMWSPRAQCDRMRFAEAWRLALEELPNLSFRQEGVAQLIVQQGRVQGVVTLGGHTFHAPAVVLTAGTFLNGVLHVGPKQTAGGRSGEAAAYGLSEQLAGLGFTTGRMKTGTPPRLDGRTIDYSKLEEQPGDDDPRPFSYLPVPRPSRQLSCHIAYTNPAVHAILNEGLDQSPMFSGAIQGTGPRYCPSIEDKITRFAERDRHQLFVEPEGWRTIEVYLNGYSSSLPEGVQMRALRQVPGFERVKAFRPGYAVEYDFFPPHQLTPWLETKAVQGLFFAGQINGTTGYEEAAAQGLMAGLNAARQVQGHKPAILGRDQAYIGVLIDDLVTKGTDEPYRMFTSRAEYRILLRQDNADSRLTPLGREWGLVDDARWAHFTQKREARDGLLNLLAEVALDPAEVNPWLEARDEAPISEKVRLLRLLSRPNLGLNDLAKVSPTLQAALEAAGPEAAEQAEIQVKYAGYIDREREQVAKMKRLEDLQLPQTLQYGTLQALSTEARQKLDRVRPLTVGQAARISGVSPADVSALLVYLGR